MLLNINFAFEINFKEVSGCSMVSAWSENAALFERLMEIYSNLPIPDFGFKRIN